ncbi:MAG: hypothetical protein AB8B96_00245 [Lysobacterales bacterium]
MIHTQNTQRLLQLGALITLLFAVSSSMAQNAVRKDVLLIDRMAKTAHHSVPANGLTMEQVVSQFGEPGNKYNAVGEPPIVRWVYSEFTVYFEYQRVIHAVINRATSSETAPDQN